MLSQFSGEETDLLIGQLAKFPKDVYPVGRLDKDSEGLLLLTNDNALKTYILEPKNKISKTYFVQVDGDITDKAIAALSTGSININHKGKLIKVGKAKVMKIKDPDFAERSTPVRFRKNIPTSWISITITEGKNRQVRKMTAAAGFPTLRLVRVAIQGLTLEDLNDGLVQEMSKKEIYSKIGFFESKY